MYAELSVLFAAVIGLAAAGESSVTETLSTRSHHPAETPSGLPSNWGHGPFIGTGRISSHSHVHASHTPWMDTRSAYFPDPTETLTTYTTLTTRPVTIKTSDASSIYYTITLETSTIVVTSCKGGCHHTRNPIHLHAPSGNMTWQPHGHHTPAPPMETITTVFPTTITTTMASFVPTSVPITDRGSTYYSTWLTTTLITTVTVSTCTSTYEVLATPSAAPFPPTITYIPIPSIYFRSAISSTSDSCPSAPTITVTNDGGSGTTCAPDTTSTETQTVYLSGSQTIEPGTVTSTQTVTVTTDAGLISTTSDAGLITTTTDAGPTTTTTIADVLPPAGTGGIAAPSGTGGAAMMGKREWYGMGGKW